MPKISVRAKRLRIYIGEADSWKGKSLYQALVLKSKELDLAGATIYSGCMGFGANSRIHSSSSLSADLPILIEIIDSEEYIQKFRPVIDLMVREGLVTIDEVEVVKYGIKPPRRYDVAKI